MKYWIRYVNTRSFVAVNRKILIGSDKTACILFNVELGTELLTLNNAIVILLAGKWPTLVETWCLKIS